VRPAGSGRYVERCTGATCLTQAARAGLVVGAAVVAQTAGLQVSWARLTLVGLRAVATGAKNAIARRLVVPDLTTTALTLTVTGLVADATPWPVPAR
jgi:hypothetical protein